MSQLMLDAWLQWPPYLGARLHLRLPYLLPALLVGCLLLPIVKGQAADLPKAGIVMKITGTTNPALSVWSEISEGAPVVLLPGAELTFLDYMRCKIVTVLGSGKLSLTNGELTTDGMVTRERQGPCPRIHQPSGTSITAGIVMRSPAVIRVPASSEIIFAGHRANRVMSAALYIPNNGDIKPRVQLELINGHRVLLPDSQTLGADREYTLAIYLEDQAKPTEFRFKTTIAHEDEMIVLRLE